MNNKALTAFLVFFLVHLNSIAQSLPNMILVIADDVSWNDIGCYGNTAIRTPRLDALAKKGMKFTNAFVTSSSCSPSRSSIITGRYPHNTGAAELHMPLPAHLTYFPEVLKKHGYYTAQAGKWHEGPNTLRAYDTLIAGSRNGAGGENMWLPLLQQRPKDQPFFFWFAAMDAHRQWQPDSMHSPHDPLKVIVPPMLKDTKETRDDIAAYYNEIARLDFYIGEINKELEKQGVLDNTLIIFMSDNGRPFPGSKTRLNDAGVKTPFLVQWPKEIKAGTECNSLISAIDIAPTLLQVAGAPIPSSIQGKSFRSLFENPKESIRDYVYTEHNWHDYEAYERAVRTRDFLYIINRRPQFSNQGPLDAVNSASFKSLLTARENDDLTPLQEDIFLVPRPQEELYAITKNGDQINNLAFKASYQSVRKKMATILAKWQQETGDTEPTSLTPDYYDRTTGKKAAGNGTRGEMPGSAKSADRMNIKQSVY